VLDGAAPRLIDEWQIVPAIWNHVRRAVDVRSQPGQFILTGSATPADDVTRHTGALRSGRVHMRPMTLAEAGRGSGAISLAALFNGEPARSTDAGLTLNDIADEIVRGGWPGIRHLPPPDAGGALRDYLDRIRRADIEAVDGVRRDPERVQAVLRSPGAAAAALRATPASLLGDLNALGLLFESLVVRDLRVYAQPLDGEVFHYCDQSGLEVDAIVDTGDRWAAFEVKLGPGQIDQAAASLTRFGERVDTSKRGEPALLGVIVATGFGYVREDWIHVIPIGALGP
jgi:predicted AAA+ superfamily ATPase